MFSKKNRNRRGIVIKRISVFHFLSPTPSLTYDHGTSNIPLDLDEGHKGSLWKIPEALVS